MLASITKLLLGDDSPPEPVKPEMMTVLDAVEYTQLTENTLYLMVDTGELTLYNFGDSAWPQFKTEDLDRIKENLHVLEFYRFVPEKLRKQEELARNGKLAHSAYTFNKPQVAEGT